MGYVLIGLGAVCAAYGVSIMLVGSGTLFFVVWYVLGGAIAGAGLAVQTGAWAALPFAIRAAATAVAAAAVVLFLSVDAVIMTHAAAAPPADLEEIIVLGAQVRPDGTPSNVLRYRLDTAADYLRQNPRTRCIVSGGQGGNEPTTEAACMASYLREQGIDASRIVLEDRSRSTVENLRFSRGLLASPADRVGIVTNDFHAFRACRIAARQGLSGACGISAPSDPWYLPNNLLREVPCVVKDFLLGNM
ncbi:YdcF family protein [Paratractidigestivibacter sp.]|uniref:YdcF family protein n=1 Tax=Paratractidigestivibacter sp. TaxID=2847316 RepID=UPI002ACB0A6E|nr:YdcF family protein [Paratractidigestivibacter sp.]